MFKKLILTVAPLLVISGGIALAHKIDKPKDENKVTICHRTNSVTNPYEKISVDESAVDGQGNNDHTLHTGPVPLSESEAQTLKDNKTKWGDIIPGKLNWDSNGQAVYLNDCTYPPDLCSNIEGVQTEVPKDKVAKNGECVGVESNPSNPTGAQGSGEIITGDNGFPPNK